MSQRTVVGVVGLGNVGGAIALRLADRGCPLVVYDVVPAAVAPMDVLGVSGTGG